MLLVMAERRLDPNYRPLPAKQLSGAYSSSTSAPNLTEQAEENAGEEAPRSIIAAATPMRVMAARVAMRRPIMRVTKARPGFRRGLYTGLLRLRLQVLWRQIGLIVRFRVRQDCAR